MSIFKFLNAKILLRIVATIFTFVMIFVIYFFYKKAHYNNLNKVLIKAEYKDFKITHLNCNSSIEQDNIIYQNLIDQSESYLKKITLKKAPEYPIDLQENCNISFIKNIIDEIKNYNIPKAPSIDHEVIVPNIILPNKISISRLNKSKINYKDIKVKFFLDSNLKINITDDLKLTQIINNLNLKNIKDTRYKIRICSLKRRCAKEVGYFL
jgi:hypothetical protein